MMPTIRAATIGDVRPLLLAMSEFDRGNLYGAFTDPKAAMEIAVAASEHTFYAEAETPLFLGGMLPEGAVWMLSTPGVANHRKFYLRETQRQRDVMLALAPRLHCSVDLRYPKSLRWLEWLGFTFGEAVDYGSHFAKRAEMMRHV